MQLQAHTREDCIYMKGTQAYMNVCRTISFLVTMALKTIQLPILYLVAQVLIVSGRCWNLHSIPHR